MSERSADEIRREIAAERQRLAEDLGTLRKEARVLAPVGVAVLIGIGLLGRRKGTGTAAKLLMKLL
jgi:hypothetical protein